MPTPALPKTRASYCSAATTGRRPEMRAFKVELRQAIDHPGQVLGDVLFSHVGYEDSGTGAFLRRLWRDLYGDEPVVGPGGAESRRRSKPEAA